MNDNLNNRSSEKRPILRLGLMLILCAYCVPFSYLITCFYTSPIKMCLIFLWIVLLGFMTRNINEGGIVAVCHSTSWLISYALAGIDVVGRVNFANLTPEDYRPHVTIISIIIWLLHELTLLIIHYIKKKKETEN